MASIKWSDLHKYSLVLVEFGNHLNQIDCDHNKSYMDGINIGSEFCYEHMAIVVSHDPTSGEIAVVPLTTYRHGDEKYHSNIVINPHEYGRIVNNVTTVKVGHIRSIDKKKRITKLIRPYVSKTLQMKIGEAISKSIG